MILRVPARRDLPEGAWLDLLEKALVRVAGYTRGGRPVAGYVRDGGEHQRHARRKLAQAVAAARASLAMRGDPPMAMDDAETATYRAVLGDVSGPGLWAAHTPPGLWLSEDRLLDVDPDDGAVTLEVSPGGYATFRVSYGQADLGGGRRVRVATWDRAFIDHGPSGDRRGVPMFRQLAATAKALGCEAVTLKAGGTIGRYMWARAGFTTTPEHFARMRGGLEQFAEVQGLDMGFWRPFIQGLRDPWELAIFDPPGHVVQVDEATAEARGLRPGPLPLGKAYLLLVQRQWPGILDIRDGATSLDRFTRYAWRPRRA